jgi:hypothetical protein
MLVSGKVADLAVNGHERLFEHPDDKIEMKRRAVVPV